MIIKVFSSILERCHTVNQSNYTVLTPVSVVTLKAVTSPTARPKTLEWDLIHNLKEAVIPAAGACLIHFPSTQLPNNYAWIMNVASSVEPNSVGLNVLE